MKTSVATTNPESGESYLKVIAAQKFNYDQFAGYHINNKLVLPVFAAEGERSVQKQIDTGLSLDVSDGIITYGFFAGQHAVGLANNPSYGEGKGYSAFSAEQKVAAAAAIQTWDDLIAPKFVNVGDVSVSGWAHGTADILFQNTTTGPQQAWAYYPSDDHGAAGRVASTVYIDTPSVQADNGWFGYGEYGATTLTHEIGHTLGFSHPGVYNGSAATTYAAQAQYAQDSTQYSIMSYWSPSETGGRMYDFQNSGGLFDLPAQTPLLHDIALIQAKYGADLTTRATNTTYGFHSNAGNGLYDFSQNVLPHMAIYDAGGNDTIDLSGYTLSQVLNLAPGTFSSIGETNKSFAEMGADLQHDYLALFGTDLKADLGYTDSKLASLSQGWYNSSLTYDEKANFADTGVHGLTTIAHDNFAIAYGTIIENAVGGQGNDYIRGNDAANRIDGQGGNDVINGGAGHDTLTGGAGADTFVLSNVEIGDLITDFNHAQGDMIDLSGLYNGTMHFIGSNALASLGDVNFVNGVLSANTTGTAAADFSVTLAGMPEVHADALVLHA